MLELPVFWPVSGSSQPARTTRRNRQAFDATFVEPACTGVSDCAGDSNCEFYDLFRCVGEGTVEAVHHPCELPIWEPVHTCEGGCRADIGPDESYTLTEPEQWCAGPLDAGREAGPEAGTDGGSSPR